MIELDNRTTCHVNISLLERIAESLSKRDIELILINDLEMAEINEQSRGIAKSTDVLSFPMVEMPGAPLGSIVISEGFVKSGSERFGHTLADERALLFIHGMLHVLGYDHEVDKGEMRTKEHEVLQTFGLPESLIIRTQQ